MPAGRNESSAPHALEAWARAVAPRAVAYARSLLADRHCAEDVVQDCFARLIAKGDAYDLAADGTKLLFASVTNACVNETTRRKPLLRLVRADGDGAEVADDPPDRRAHAADERLAHAELAAAVAAELAALPPQQRAAVELKSLGYSQVEVAEILGVMPSNAGVLIHRGRQSLAVALSAFLPGEATS